jgi:hypothetical protein
MKKRLFVYAVAATTVLSVSIYSCKKDSQSADNLTTSTSSVTGNESEFAAEFLKMTAMVPEGSHLAISTSSDGKFVYTIMKNSNNPNARIAAKILCTGQLNLTFANCVKEALKSLGCVVISAGSTAGVYNATGC